MAGRPSNFDGGKGPEAFRNRQGVERLIRISHAPGSRGAWSASRAGGPAIQPMSPRRVRVRRVLRWQSPPAARRKLENCASNFDLHFVRSANQLGGFFRDCLPPVSEFSRSEAGDTTFQRVQHVGRQRLHRQKYLCVSRPDHIRKRLMPFSASTTCA